MNQKAESFDITLSLQGAGSVFSTALAQPLKFSEENYECALTNIIYPQFKTDDQEYLRKNVKMYPPVILEPKPKEGSWEGYRRDIMKSMPHGRSLEWWLKKLEWMLIHSFYYKDGSVPELECMVDRENETIDIFHTIFFAADENDDKRFKFDAVFEKAYNRKYSLLYKAERIDVRKFKEEPRPYAENLMMFSFFEREDILGWNPQSTKEIVQQRFGLRVNKEHWNITWPEPRLTGKRIVNIYSNITEPSIIGDVEAPFVRSLPPFIYSKDRFKSFSPEKPFYHRVSQRRVDEIKIVMRDDVGEEVDLRGKCVFITLNFRHSHQ